MKLEKLLHLIQQSTAGKKTACMRAQWLVSQRKCPFHAGSQASRNTLPLQGQVLCCNKGDSKLYWSETSEFTCTWLCRDYETCKAIALQKVGYVAKLDGTEGEKGHKFTCFYGRTTLFVPETHATHQQARPWVSNQPYSIITLTSFKVMIFGCCPYRRSISISSEGSCLLLSITCKKVPHLLQSHINLAFISHECSKHFAHIGSVIVPTVL